MPSRIFATPLPEVMLMAAIQSNGSVPGNIGNLLLLQRLVRDGLLLRPVFKLTQLGSAIVKDWERAGRPTREKRI